MLRNNKAQLSIETMIIYGLVFLIALSVVGGLLYFDVLNVGSYLPEECDLGTRDLVCEETRLSGSNDEFELGVRNVGNRDISVLNITVDSTTGTLTGTETLEPGSVGAITWETAPTISPGQVLEEDLVVTYKYSDGAITQESVGSIRITAS